MHGRNRWAYWGIVLGAGIGITEIGGLLPERIATIVWGCEKLNEPCMELAKKLNSGTEYFLFGLGLALLGLFERFSRKPSAPAGDSEYYALPIGLFSLFASLWNFHTAYVNFNDSNFSLRESAHVDITVLMLSSLLVYSILAISAGTFTSFFKRKLLYDS